MFNLLKNKLSNFIKGLAGKEEKKEPAPTQKEGAKGESAKQAATPPLPPDEKSAQPQTTAKEEKEKAEEHLKLVEKKVSAAKKEIAPKISLGTAIKSFFSDEITISEADVSDLLGELELSLIEADVAYEIAVQISEGIKKELVGKRVPKGQVEKSTREAIEKILVSLMENGKWFDLPQRAKSSPKPVKILFIGPNGAGKTTTIAKVAKLLMGEGLSVVFSASDTFRAAAIEQTEAHASRLGIKVVKSKYGADPASVAFDAINYAKAHNIDVVLIDSAGRQDTNTNLILELKKIVRVAKPDLKIYVGESIGGNAMVEQIRTFNEAIGLDGAILTKLDCDAKGGTAISVAKTAHVPILYFGVGQGYGDLIPFDAKKIAQDIMS
ncbi:MAG: signal recognition particle-docking protein FtsY [Candidatus Micrarchaeota archaeon]|nr:signal recognition particle-docking protein FtsY [Candidatus Micrarchaeota archaeon]